MSKDDRRFSLFPKTLSACIEPVTRPILKTQGLAGSRIISEWPAIVGKELSSRCIPQSLSFPPGKKVGGTLAIAVESGFAPALQHQQPVIIERLATYFGYRAVTRITIAHTYTPEQKTSEKKPPKKHITALLTVGEEVTDPELKAALEAMAATLSGAS